MGKLRLSPGGGGGDLDVITAGAADVVAPKVIVDKDGEPVVGTMPHKGAWVGSVGMNGSVAIPAGKHNGSGKVNGPAVTQRGAWTGRIGVNGKIAIPEGYHNGAGYVDQSIATQGGQTVNPTNTQQVVYCSGKYMTGNITVPAVSNLAAQYIKKGIWVGNVLGTFEGYVAGVGDLFYNGANPSGMVVNSGDSYLGIDSTAMWMNSGGSVNRWMFFRTSKTYTFNAGSRIYVQAEGNIRSMSGTCRLDTRLVGELLNMQLGITLSILNDNTIYYTVPRTMPNVYIYLPLSKSGSTRISRVWME